MSLIIWDTSILPPQTVDFEPEVMSRSGGQSIFGNEQIVVSSAGRWRATYSVKIFSIRQRLTYRGWKAASNGRAGTWLIPTCSGFQVLGGSSLADVFGLTDAFALEDVFESTDSAYPIASDATVATAAAAVAARSISISMSDQTPPAPGLYFSIGSGGTKSLYLISGATRTAANAYTLTFWPGLRTAVAINDLIDFATPACRMRLASDTTGAMPLDQLKFSTLSLEFVEDF